MNQVIIDIWPYLMPVIIAGIAGLIGWIHNLRTRVAILEKTVENQQKRLDTHSKKQDEILGKMNSMEHQLMKEISSVNVGMAELKSDIQGLARLLSFCDNGYKIKRDTNDI